MTHEDHDHQHPHDDAEADSIITGLLIAKNVEGDVTAVFNPQTAAIAGCCLRCRLFPSEAAVQAMIQRTASTSRIGRSIESR